MEAASPWHWRGDRRLESVRSLPARACPGAAAGPHVSLETATHRAGRAGGPGAAAGCVLPLSGEEATLQRGAAFAAVARFPHGPSRSPRAPRGDV